MKEHYFYFYELCDNDNSHVIKSGFVQNLLNPHSALHDYFYSNKKYYLETKYFTTDFALMIDILNKTSFLSNALQAINIDIRAV